MFTKGENIRMFCPDQEQLVGASLLAKQSYRQQAGSYGSFEVRA